MCAETQVDSYVAQRRNMVESQLRARGIRDERILAAMSHVPRHEFVSAEHRDQVYEDHPIPIGEGQTLSQPYIVAITLEALVLDPENVVLEIGTGSGYQTALLSELTRRVYSAERHFACTCSTDHTRPPRLRQHRCRRRRRQPRNSRTRALRRYRGPAAAPASPPLFAQLREGGCMGDSGRPGACPGTAVGT